MYDIYSSIYTHIFFLPCVRILEKVLPISKIKKIVKRPNFLRQYSLQFLVMFNILVD